MSLEEIENTHSRIPDMLQQRTLYAITINPEDQCEKEPLRLKTITNRMLKIFNKCSCELSLWPEFSSPPESITKGKYRMPRLHWHGFILFQNVKQLCAFYERDWIRMSYNKAYVHIQKLDEVKGKEAWKAYCTKNKKDMKRMYKYNKLDYTFRTLNIKTFIEYGEGGGAEEDDSKSSSSPSVEDDLESSSEPNPLDYQIKK